MNFYMYARKSTDEDDKQLLSIEAQLEELREHATKERLTVAQEFVEARTAKVPGRPVFNEMMKAIEKGQADGILAWHPDRLARNSVDGGRIIYLVDTGKITALKFPSFWFENTPQGKFMLSIAFGQSKYYVDNLSENVKRGIRQKLRLGWFPGRPPIGYVNEPRLRTIVIDDEKAPLVKRLFETYATGGVSYQAIVDMADRMGLITVRDHRFRKSWMHGLLSNPFYTGIFRLKGEAHEGAHEPLISRDLFDRVQAVLNKRSRARTKTRSDDPCFFVGLMKCDECGSGITAQRQKGHHYYNCTRKRGPCEQRKYIREEPLAQEVHAALSRVALPTETADAVLAQVDKWQTEEVKRSGELATQHRARVGDLQTRLNRLLDVYLEGTIDKDEYTGRKEAFIREKASLTAELAQIESNGASWIEPMRAFVTDCRSMTSELADADSEQIALLARKTGLNLHLTGARIQREECAESESGLRKSEDGKTDRLPLGGPAVRVVGPASECRGGGVAARPAKVSPQKDQEKRVFCASSEVASLSESDTASLSADSSGAFAAWDKSFVFQVSDREPALRVTYPPPFNVVAALAASPASENAGRSVWWAIEDSNLRPPPCQGGALTN